ncbi:LysE family translocator [Mesorhizobium sp. 1B3]|uniref:LysE family translocator n=1 Tax=Mesorhizobium sp. 1B3 TaxID=3243599 RepID=UPI003D99AE0E
MTLVNIIALFGSMLVLAAIPSLSVLAVSTRSAAGGFAHGAATTVGIVAGDLIYILVAIFGLALLTDAVGDAAYLIGYVGGAYLIWMGVSLWRCTPNQGADQHGRHTSSLFSSFLAGLLLTLADQKVVVFYLGFFPAFLDLAAVGQTDIAIVMIVTILAVGSVKLTYALLARKVANVVGAKASNLLNKAAGALMVGVGVFLFATT